MIEIAIGIFFAALDERKKKERNQQQQRAHRQEHTGSGKRTAGGDSNFHNR